jgi:hypothetical protein
MQAKGVTPEMASVLMIAREGLLRPRQLGVSLEAAQNRARMK